MNIRDLFIRLQEVGRDRVTATSEQADRSWKEVPRSALDRKGATDRIFPLHLVRGALSWATRLVADQRADGRSARAAKKIRVAAALWPTRSASLYDAYALIDKAKAALEAHRIGHEGMLRRLLTGLILASLAVAFLVFVDLPFIRGGLELVIDDPEQRVLGLKVVDLASWGFVLFMAALVKSASSSLRRIRDGGAARADYSMLALCCLAAAAAVLPFAGARQQAADASAGQGSGLQTIGGSDASPGGEEQDRAFPWLMAALGVAPFVLGTIALSGAQTAAAEEDAALWATLQRARALGVIRVCRFGRVVRQVDRREATIESAARRLARDIARDEAERLNHANGYRLVSETWAGWLPTKPTLISGVERGAPGRLPGADADMRQRFSITASELAHGGPTRRALEARYGNPVAERAAEMHEQYSLEGLLVDFASRRNGHGSPVSVPEPGSEA